MYLVDTHTHIFLEDFDSDRDDVIQKAFDNGVEKLCLPNIDTASIPRLLSVTDNYPEKCFPMMGLHPTSVGETFRNDLLIVKEELKKRKYVAVGEIGIDLYWDTTFKQQQIEAFEEQLLWSMESNLPVVIHTRNAFPEVFDSLRKVGPDKLRGVFHSFGGSKEDLAEALSFRNFMLGINGVVTYKNAHFREYLNDAPLSRIILETDAPYLTPVPYRGKRNEPAHLIHIARKLAEIYDVSFETVAEKTTENAESLFGI
ncbi:MAG: TatD family hydrolase [Dysgonamonadaceae bacterium]|jgi:TatD DNase family protein|nr:TatD family hydrolase [Dysgonamonadaceae bacterium]